MSAEQEADGAAVPENADSSAISVAPAEAELAAVQEPAVADAAPASEAPAAPLSTDNDHSTPTAPEVDAVDTSGDVDGSKRAEATSPVAGDNSMAAAEDSAGALPEGAQTATTSADAEVVSDSKTGGTDDGGDLPTPTEAQPDGVAAAPEAPEQSAAGDSEAKTTCDDAPTPSDETPSDDVLRAEPVDVQRDDVGGEDGAEVAQPVEPVEGYQDPATADADTENGDPVSADANANAAGGQDPSSGVMGEGDAAPAIDDADSGVDVVASDVAPVAGKDAEAPAAAVDRDVPPGDEAGAAEARYENGHPDADGYFDPGVAPVESLPDEDAKAMDDHPTPADAGADDAAGQGDMATLEQERRTSEGHILPSSGTPRTVAEHEGLDEAPLPADWQEVLDHESGYVYYWNHVTDETTWERPVPSGTDAAPEHDAEVEHAAAVAMQAAGRGFLARQRVAQLRADTTDAREADVKAAQDDDSVAVAEGGKAAEVEAGSTGVPSFHEEKEQQQKHEAEDGVELASDAKHEDADDTLKVEAEEKVASTPSPPQPDPVSSSTDDEETPASPVSRDIDRSANTGAPVEASTESKLEAASPEPSDLDAAIPEPSDLDADRVAKTTPSREGASPVSDDGGPLSGTARTVSVPARCFVAVDRSTQTSPLPTPQVAPVQESAPESTPTSEPAPPTASPPRRVGNGPLPLGVTPSPRKSRLPVYRPSGRTPKRSAVSKGDDVVVTESGKGPATRSPHPPITGHDTASLLAKYRRGLHVMFTFYVTAQSALASRRRSGQRRRSGADSKEEVDDGGSQQQLNVAMFVKCCRDFGLLGDLLTGAEIIGTFKQVALTAGVQGLDERHFGVCLAECAHKALSRQPYVQKYRTKGSQINGLFRRCVRSVC